MEAHYISFLSFSHSVSPSLPSPSFFSLENINPDETDMVSPLENFYVVLQFFHQYHYSEIVLYGKTTLRNKGLGMPFKKTIKFKCNSLFEVRNEKPFNKNHMVNVIIE